MRICGSPCVWGVYSFPSVPIVTFLNALVTGVLNCAISERPSAQLSLTSIAMWVSQILLLPLWLTAWIAI